MQRQPLTKCKLQEWVQDSNSSTDYKRKLFMTDANNVTNWSSASNNSVCNGPGRSDDDTLILFRLGFSRFAQITCGLVGGGLIVCFVTSILFHFDEVNKTFCDVRNLVPSISSVTGVAPQRYVWRIAVGLHSAPRFVIGVVYSRYFAQRQRYSSVTSCCILARLVFWLYVIENLCLVGITYIASAENYKVHERLFIVFMCASLLYQLLLIVLFRVSHPHMESNSQIARSYAIKRFSFLLTILLTAGLLYFFYLHRWHCTPGAFTKFALCEYGIVALNILYHYTAAYEFCDHAWHVIIKRKF